jgi:hypothetical protein
MDHAPIELSIPAATIPHEQKYMTPIQGTALALVRGDGPLMKHAVRSAPVGVFLVMIRSAQRVSPDRAKRFIK